MIIIQEKKLYKTEGEVSLYSFIGYWLWDALKLEQEAEILNITFNNNVLVLLIDGYVQVARKYQKDNDIVIEITEYKEKNQ